MNIHYSQCSNFEHSSRILSLGDFLLTDPAFDAAPFPPGRSERAETTTSHGWGLTLAHPPISAQELFAEGNELPPAISFLGEALRLLLEALQGGKKKRLLYMEHLVTQIRELFVTIIVDTKKFENAIRQKFSTLLQQTTTDEEVHLKFSFLFT